MVKYGFTVRVGKEVIDALDARARELGISRAKLVEKILADYLNIRLRSDPVRPIEVLQNEIGALKREVEAIRNELEALRRELEAVKPKQATLKTAAPAAKTK